jgi:hypothetical protein
MRNHKELSIQELESMLNPTAAIAILQNAIDMEAVTKSANSILDNDIEFLTCDYKISQAQILLSLLRMRQRL